MHRYTITIWTALAAGLLLASCGRGGGHEPAVPQAGRGFSMQVLDESFAVQGAADFRMEVQQESDRALLRIHVEDATELSHAYLEIGYDQTQWTPVEAQSAGLLGEDALTLLAGNGHGLVQYGEIIPGADPPGVEGAGLLATIEFRPGAQTAGKSVSAAPKTAPAVSRNARWDILSWYYENPGDYDQNGVVTIADLTPLGVNLNTSGPFSEDSALFMVDGDGNGEINLSDITPIGVNFGNSVDGYTLYAGEDGNGYPASPGDDNGGSARSVVSVDFAAALGGGNTRKSFKYTDNAVELHDRYWLRQFSGETASPASALTEAWQKDWERTVIHTQENKLLSERAALSVVAGRPCVLFGTGSTENNIALFSRGSDRIGGDWSTPVKVSGQQTDVTHLQMMDHDGVPVIAFGSNDNDVSFFREANDATGGGWKNIVTLLGASFFPVDMIRWNGQVMVISHDFNQGVALQGTLDNTFFNSLALGLMSNVQAMPREDALEICFRQNNLNQSRHGYLDHDGDFFNYSSDTLLTNDFNLDEITAVFDYAGQFNMLMHDDLFYGYSLVQGQSGTSGIFTTPAVILGEDIADLRQTEALGRIWTVQVNVISKHIESSYCAVDDLSVWHDAVPLDSESAATFSPEIATVSNHPAVVYVNELDGNQHELVFARYI